MYLCNSPVLKCAVECMYAIYAKTILSKSKVLGYTVNPYLGARANKLNGGEAMHKFTVESFHQLHNEFRSVFRVFKTQQPHV